MANEEQDDFIKWVKSLTKDEFYEECVECRLIRFGTLDGDNIDYFYNLVDAYAAAKKQALIDKACEWLKENFNVILESFNCDTIERVLFTPEIELAVAIPRSLWQWVERIDLPAAKASTCS